MKSADCKIAFAISLSVCFLVLLRVILILFKIVLVSLSNNWLTKSKNAFGVSVPIFEFLFERDREGRIPFRGNGEKRRPTGLLPSFNLDRSSNRMGILYVAFLSNDPLVKFVCHVHLNQLYC